jgi:hypothetical protein
MAARLRFRNAPSRIYESTSVDGDNLAESGPPAEPSQSPGLSVNENVAMAASVVAMLEVMLEGLKSGTRSWADWDESLADTPNRSDVAVSRGEADLARARAELRALTRSAGADEVPGTELQTARGRASVRLSVDDFE